MRENLQQGCISTEYEPALSKNRTHGPGEDIKEAV
jgi:hypothetical protein